MNQYECEAEILSVTEKEIVLNQTVFYAQGGGQPSDTGIISWEGGQMKVEKVYWDSDQIIHTGEIHGQASIPGQSVKCTIDHKNRELNSKLHSAGHAIDMAIKTLPYDLKPNKGFHYPEGPYVEYNGSIENQERFIEELESTLGKIINNNEMTSIQCEETSTGKTHRTVSFGNYKVACGGTHVGSLGELKGLYIRKIKSKKGKVKISYNLK